ncbi:unnamed protein product, partial [Ectocarpus sp. 13 AM-2016]
QPCPCSPRNDCRSHPQLLPTPPRIGDDDSSRRGGNARESCVPSVPSPIQHPLCVHRGHHQRQRGGLLLRVAHLRKAHAPPVPERQGQKVSHKDGFDSGRLISCPFFCSTFAIFWFR